MSTKLYIAIIIAVASCGQSTPRTLLADPDGASTELRAACALTQKKCTRCHPIGKVFAIDVQTRDEWEPIIDRMRRISASTITIEDSQVILSCLEQTNSSRAPGD